MVSDCSLASVLILQSPLGKLSTFREQKKPLALSETVEPFLKLSLGQQPTSCRSEQEQPRDEQEEFPCSCASGHILSSSVNATLMLICMRLVRTQVVTA